jgi:hypothetical protein
VTETLVALPWDEVVASALIGTDRRPARAMELPTDLAPWSDATDLLATASALWAYREAGRRFPVTSEPPAAAPADTRPLLPTAALRSLSIILADRKFKPLVQEWLALAHRRGGRLPGELVPAVLDATPMEARSDARGVAGPVAAWLAGYRPEWAWAAAPPVNESLDAGDELARAWRGGDDERLAVFAAVRAADPDRARTFLEQAWADEPAVTRATLVNALAEGLSMADESFLERCLDDRRKDVRRAAAALLGRLPESRFAMRMAQRVLPLVRVSSRLRPRLTVVPPTGLDSTTRRDVVDLALQGGAEDPMPALRDYWITQLVAAAPLSMWVVHLGRPPGELIRLAQRVEAHSVLHGWTAAAIRQADAEWAAELIAAGVGLQRDLIGVLPTASADGARIRLLAERPLSEVIELLPFDGAQWSAQLTTAVIEALKRTAGNSDLRSSITVREALPAMALAAHPSYAPAAAQLGATLEDASNRSFWERPLAALAATLHFRLAMSEELQ